MGFLLQTGRGASTTAGGTTCQVEFLGDRSWPVEATARQNIDADGPGLFTVEPGRTSSNGFLASFTSAEGMRVRPDGESADTLPLAGSRGAMTTLARCLSERWENAPAQAAEEGDEDKAALAIDTI